MEKNQGMPITWEHERCQVGYTDREEDMTWRLEKRVEDCSSQVAGEVRMVDLEKYANRLKADLKVLTACEDTDRKIIK